MARRRRSSVVNIGLLLFIWLTAAVEDMSGIAFVLLSLVMVTLIGGMFFRFIYKSKRLRALQLADVDTMNPQEFEEYVGQLLVYQGFRITFIGGAGDLGVDLIAQKDGMKYAIQVKRYAKSVSRRAVSDAVAGKDHYRCNAAMVVTNNFFTEGARTLARSTGCKLVDRNLLAHWILAFQRQDRADMGGGRSPP